MTKGEDERSTLESGLYIISLLQRKYLDLSIPWIELEAMDYLSAILEAQEAINVKLATKEIMYLLQQLNDTTWIQQHFPKPPLFAPV
jgi:hypothetical protein